MSGRDLRKSEQTPSGGPLRLGAFVFAVSFGSPFVLVPLVIASDLPPEWAWMTPWRAASCRPCSGDPRNRSAPGSGPSGARDPAQLPPVHPG